MTCPHKEPIEEKYKQLKSKVDDLEKKVSGIEIKQEGTKVYVTQILGDIQEIKRDIKEALSVKQNGTGMKHTIDLLKMVFGFILALLGIKMVV